MKKVANIICWIIACFLAALSFGAIQTSVISCIFLLISAFIVSPISDNVPFLKDILSKFKPLKIVLPILFFMIAVVVPDSNPVSNNTDSPTSTVDKAETTTNTTTTANNTTTTSIFSTTTTASMTTMSKSTTTNTETTTSTYLTAIATTATQMTTSTTLIPTTQSKTEPLIPEPTIPVTEPPVFVMNYILNTNTMKAHTTHCGEASKIKVENKQEYSGTSEELASYGYSPCGRCKPW